MAGSEERKRFWDTLLNLRDGGSDSCSKLLAAIPRVSKVCRFRTVNESSLDQLQSNRLLFSSADHYDDPFDTYFYINYDAIKKALATLQAAYSKGGVNALRPLLNERGFGLRKDGLLNMVLEHIDCDPPNISLFERQFGSLRSQIMKDSYSICFCDDPMNESLWLKYADNHRGFVQIYDLDDSGVVRCGTSRECVNCLFGSNPPTLYPVYYSDDRYDATRFAITELLLNNLPCEMTSAYPTFAGMLSNSVVWEMERISLIKKECHEYDGEWRMICPSYPKTRPGIAMKPSSIAVGLRMPEYERRLVVSAAIVAGISDIFEMYINRDDQLAMRPVSAIG